MAKTQATTTLSPYDLSIGAPIFADREINVIEMIHWTAWRRPVVHLSLTTGPDGWDTANSKGYHNIYFTGSSVIRYSLLIDLDEDGDDVTVGAVCSFAVGNTGDVVFTIGGVSATLSFAAADTGEKTATIAKASSGTGWQLCTIAIQRTAGASSTNELRHVRVQETRMTSGLPDPVIEGDGETVDVYDEGTNTVASARILDVVGDGAVVTDAGSSRATLTVQKKLTRTAVTGNYTVTAENQVLAVTSGTPTITLRAAATAGAGAWLWIVDEAGAAATNNITIDANGSETISGALQYVITVNYGRVLIECNGSNWFVVTET